MKNRLDSSIRLRAHFTDLASAKLIPLLGAFRRTAIDLTADLGRLVNPCHAFVCMEFKRGEGLASRRADV